MNKAISVAAILALSAASSEFADLELANLHLEQPRLHRPTLSPLVRDVAHDDEQMVRINPEIMKPHYRTFAPLVADDNDDEFVYATPLRADDNDDEYFVAPGLVADDEFYVDEQVDNELNIFKKIGDGLKKAGKFVVSHPQIITTAAKFLDDNDDEYFVAPGLVADDEFYADEQADDELLIRLNPELTRPHTRFPVPIMAADDNDDEFVYAIYANPLRADDNDEYFVAPGLVADDEFYVDDEFFVDEQVDDELFAHDAAFVKKAQREVRASNEALKKAYIEKKTSTQDSLSSLGGLLKEGQRIQPRRPQPAKTQEVQDNMNFLEDFQDNNLSIKDKLKGAANWVGDHPQVITEAAKTYKALKGKH